MTVSANQATVRAQSPCHVDVISPGWWFFFFSTANQIKDSALRVENKPRTDLHYTETNKSEVRKRETKSECNGCGAIHISFDYKVLVSSMDPLAGNAGLFTTLEQTQTSMSINSVIIIFEWIFTALPYPSFSLQFWMSALRDSSIIVKPHNWIVFVEHMFRGKSSQQCRLH